MNKEDVVWFENVETVVMEDQGWKLILMSNHFKYKFWYEIQTPEKSYLDFTTTDIYEAIDKINEEIERNKKQKTVKIKKREKRKNNLKLYIFLIKIIIKNKFSKFKVLFEFKDSEE